MTVSVAQAGILPATSGYSGSLGSSSTAGNSLLLAVTAFSGSNVVLSTSSPLLGGSPVTGAVKLATQQSAFAGNNTCLVDIWLLPNIPGGQTTLSITVTNGTNNANVGIGYAEISGLGSSPALDKSSAGTGNSAAYDSGSTAVTTQASEIWFGGAIAVNGISAPASGGWTSQTLPAMDLSYQVASSTGPARLNGTAVSGVWSAAVVTIPGLASTMIIGDDDVPWHLRSGI